MNLYLLIQLRKPIPAMFFFFFFFSSLLRLAVAYESKTMMACEPKSCGSVQNISYPFWLDKQHPSYCGYPEFKLTCMNNTPLLKLPYQQLLVQKIFYANNSMLLTEFIEDDCSFPNNSLSVVGTPFGISPANKKLILYYGCSAAPPASFQIRCTSNAIFFRLGGDYMLPQDLGSCKSTIVPVSSYAGTNKSDFRTFLQNGFLLNWTVHDCSECEASNGVCGYNNEAAGFACICADRFHLESCSEFYHTPCSKIFICP